MGEPSETMLNSGWFAVRCLFEVDPGDWDGVEPRTYEERITLWQAADFDAAIMLAEKEAREYATTVDAAYLGLAQSSRADAPVHGAEIYSLMRDSNLEPASYLDHFFDTGRERQQRTS
jgi:hypothetical protein